MAAIPVFPVGDLDRTADFYRRLGFTQQRRYPTYLVAVREDIELHFSVVPNMPPPEQSLSACYIRTDRADALHAEWRSLNLSMFSPIEDRPWGMREFHLIDPDGNLVKVGYSID